MVSNAYISTCQHECDWTLQHSVMVHQNMASVPSLFFSRTKIHPVHETTHTGTVELIPFLSHFGHQACLIGSVTCKIIVVAKIYFLISFFFFLKPTFQLNASVIIRANEKQQTYTRQYAFIHWQGISHYMHMIHDLLECYKMEKKSK